MEYQSTIHAYAEAKEAETKRINDEHKENLTTVKKEFESDLPKVRSDAVANYLATHRLPRTCPGSGQVSGSDSSEQVHDGTVKEQLPVDEETIGNCAEDANKLAEWQEYARLNHIPVEQ